MSAQARTGEAEKGELLMTTTAARELPQVLYTVEEVMTMLKMGRTQFYDQVHANRLVIVKQGRSTRVTAADLDAYVKLLRSEAESR